MKTILLAPDCHLTEDELMRFNQTIANPTNRLVKQELAASSEEEEPDLSCSISSVSVVRLALTSP